MSSGEDILKVGSGIKAIKELVSALKEMPKEGWEAMGQAKRDEIGVTSLTGVEQQLARIANRLNDILEVMKSK